MTTAAIREKLCDYIRDADDKKVQALYLILEDQIPFKSDWSDDKAFVAALDEEYKSYEEGIDKGMTLEEFEASMGLRRQQPGNL
jgi:hypothetical protein